MLTSNTTEPDTGIRRDYKALLSTAAKLAGALAVALGVIGIILAPLVGASVFEQLWGVEPFTYLGVLVITLGLACVSLAYAIPQIVAWRRGTRADNASGPPSWSQVTQQYFELFDHDLGRPFRRILGKQRELRAVLQNSDGGIEPHVKDLLDEIERQAPNFRLMMSNIRVLVQLEEPNEPKELHPVEPAQVIRRIVDRYTPIARESKKDLIWWSDPSEFGIVYSDSSAIEHIVTNLVDNAMRFATTQVEVRVTKNPTHFFIRVWDDGSGIAAQYTRHIFDRGWTPEVARREEKSSSGLGLFIARTLARRYGGDLTIESVPAPDRDHHTSFLLSLPLLQGTP